MVALEDVAAQSADLLIDPLFGEPAAAAAGRCAQAAGGSTSAAPRPRRARSPPSTLRSRSLRLVRLHQQRADRAAAGGRYLGDRPARGGGRARCRSRGRAARRRHRCLAPSGRRSCPRPDRARPREPPASSHVDHIGRQRRQEHGHDRRDLLGCAEPAERNPALRASHRAALPRSRPHRRSRQRRRGRRKRQRPRRRTPPSTPGPAHRRSARELLRPTPDRACDPRPSASSVVTIVRPTPLLPPVTT